jgi:hypothetical protein
MNITDIFYTAISTIVVMVVLQVATFMVTRMLYPPEPKIVYRDGPIQYVQAPQNGPVLTQEVKLPEYEPRTTTAPVHLEPELPADIKETRPDGT